MINKKYNDINIPVEIDDSIEKGVKKALEDQKYNKKYRNKPFVKVASVAVISIGLLGTINVGGYVFANANEIFYSIADFLGIQRDLEDYKTVVNKSITKKGLTIKLNEVVLDGNDLIVSTTFKSEKEIEDGYVHSNPEIYINGKLKGMGYGGGSKAINKNTVESVINHDIENAIKGDVDIKLVYSDIEYTEGGRKKHIRDRFVFEFKTNGDNLSLDTDYVALDKTFELGTDETIKLEQFTSNSMGQKIYYSRDIHNSKFASYNLKLVGKDDLGNDVEFYNYRGRANYGVFTYDNLDKNLAENAKELTLSLYAAKQPETSGKSNDDYKLIGDKFTINISK